MLSTVAVNRNCNNNTNRTNQHDTHSSGDHDGVDDFDLEDSYKIIFAELHFNRLPVRQARAPHFSVVTLSGQVLTTFHVSIHSCTKVRPSSCASDFTCLASLPRLLES